MQLLLFVSMVYFIYCQELPQQKITSNKALAIGLTAMNRQEVVKTTTCIQNPVFKQKELTSLGVDAISCATSALGATKMASLGLLIAPLETCFLTKLSTTAVISTKVASVLYPAVEKIYGKILAKVKSDRKAGKNKTQVLNMAFKIVNDMVNKSFVNQLCEEFKKKMTRPQFDCLLNHGNKIFDLRTYKCAEEKKANLMSG